MPLAYEVLAAAWRGRLKFLNLFLLICAYAFGQGSIFLVQTWLLSKGLLDLIAQFGLSFYFIMLAIQVVDFGSATILAREAAIHAAQGTSQDDALWREYWNITPTRVVAALCTAVGGLVYAHVKGGTFGQAYMFFAWPALIVWSFNAGGILDGLRLSGVSGTVGALPYVVSAAALLLVANQTPHVAGLVLGASLSLGYMLSVAIQMLVLRQMGRHPRVIIPVRSGIIEAAKRGGGSLLITVPGQLYFRIQLSLSNAVLGHGSTAVFLYAKQVVTAFLQLVGFLRRIEFPDLVNRLAKSSRTIALDVITSQAWAVSVGLFGAIAVTVVAGFFVATGHGNSSAAGLAAAAFAPSILANALSASFSQGLVAIRRYHTAAFTMLIAVLVATVVSFILVHRFNIYAFAIADVVANVASLFFALYFLKRNVVNEEIDSPAISSLDRNTNLGSGD
ncbi:MAG: hypothetical protein JWO59_1888 [Chloroflexi bacterium]|nr:hypothetical protein [Chloroflexota bacterium]